QPPSPAGAAAAAAWSAACWASAAAWACSAAVLAAAGPAGATLGDRVRLARHSDPLGRELLRVELLHQSAHPLLLGAGPRPRAPLCVELVAELIAQAPAPTRDAGQR